MKRIFFITMMLSVLISSGMLMAQDNSLQKVKTSKKLVLGLDDTFPPMGFRDAKGDIVGFDIDLAKEVAKRIGVELELKPLDWSTVILSLNKGDIDVIWNGMTITESRKKQINFSNPYVLNRLAIVVSQGSKIKTKADLKGKKVGVQLGSSNEEALLKDPVGKDIKDIRKYDVNVNAFLDLNAKRIDAVVVDEIVARYYITSNKAKFIVLDETLTDEEYGIGFRKKDNTLRKEVDRILDEMKKDGTTSAISKKWFSADIVKK